MKYREIKRPETLKEAERLLSKNSVIIGGGAWLKQTSKIVDVGIDLDGLHLHDIYAEKGQLIIGSMATLRDVEQHPIIQDLCDGILQKACANVMGVQLRNIATIGGTVMGKYSFSDVLGPLLVLEAKLTFYQSGKMTLQEFLEHKKPIKDILVDIRIPLQQGRGYFKKVSNTVLDFAILNIAVTKKEDVKIAVGARPGTSRLAVTTMNYLNDNQWTEEVLHKAIQLLDEDISLSSNNRASKEYRKDVMNAYVLRGLKEVM